MKTPEKREMMAYGMCGLTVLGIWAALPEQYQTEFGFAVLGLSLLIYLTLSETNRISRL